MTDWGSLGSDPAAAFERHRQEMVAHFIRLRQVDAGLARSALATYVGRHHCPFPKIADDVKAEWAKVVEQQKAADAATEPAGSRTS